MALVFAEDVVVGGVETVVDAAAEIPFPAAVAAFPQWEASFVVTATPPADFCRRRLQKTEAQRQRKR